MSVRAIRPIEITPAMVVESSLFDTSPTTYNAGTTYALGAYASVAGALGEILIYKSLQAGNINNTPISSPTWWVYSSSTYEAYSQGSSYPFGYKVYDTDTKYLYQSATENNTNVLDPITNPPWFDIGTNASTLPAVWSNVTTYALGDYVYYTLTVLGGTFGQPVQMIRQLVFKSLQAGNTGNAPDFLTDTAFWSRQFTYPVPWVNSVGYAATRVVYTPDNKLWQTTLGCRGVLPNSSFKLTWIKLQPSNKMAMFDGEVSSQSVANGEMSTTIFTGVIDTLALVGLQGGLATVTVRDGFGGTIVYEQSQGISGEIVADWWAFLYGDASIPLRKAVFTELPPYINAHVTIKIVGDGEVRLGAIAAGVQTEIGLGASYGANIEVKDYSVKTTDDFGKSKFVKRGFKEVLELSVLLEKTEFNRVHNTFINLRSEPWFLIVADDPDLSEALYMYGFYNSYRNVIEYPTATIYSLQFESLVS